MTPDVKSQCANYVNGRCLGVGIARNGSLYRFADEGLPCKVLAGERCGYWEECVRGSNEPKVAPTMASVRSRTRF